MRFLPIARPWASAGLAFLAYSLLALVFVWPLPLHLSDHLTGDPSGDAGAYVWNAYVFSRNVSTGSSIFTTDQILTFTRESSLALHNNSLFLSALAAPLIPSLDVIASFNLALIVVLVLNPFCAYLLIRQETRSELPSWIGGALFGFSPFVSARIEGHMSLATVFALPLILLAARQAMIRDQSRRWGLAGLALALAATADPYFLVFGVLGLAVVWSFERVAVSGMDSPQFVWLQRAAGLLAVLSLAVVLWIVTTGGGKVSMGPLQVGVRSLYTPVLVLSIAVAAILFAWRPLKLSLREGSLAALSRPAFAGLVAAVLLYPWLRVAAAEVADRGGAEASLWRSSPPGVDLLAFFMPNPANPWFRSLFEPWLARDRPDAFVEGVASGTVTAILLLGVLVLSRQGVVSRFWVWFTAVFAALSLGPFIVVGGVDTHVPGPWALLRFIPGLGMVRSPTRFSIMAMLGLSVLLAQALASAQLGRRRGLVLMGASLLLGLETFGPLNRRIFGAELPERYRVVAEDRCDVAVLRLPTGIKDGTRQRGRFNTRTQFRQVLHRKRLVGGYLSRVSNDVLKAYELQPTLRALFDLSEGKALSPQARQAGVREAAQLSRDMGIGFIALSKTETSVELRDFVHEAFEPRTILKSGRFVISIPFGEACAKGECGHQPGCPHRFDSAPPVL